MSVSPARAILSLAAGLCVAGGALAQEPEFFERPYAPEQWNYGRRFDESQLRYCVDPRDPAWEVEAEIAEALAAGLLLEPVRYTVDKDLVTEDITKVYELLLKNCDIHLGFKLIPEGYPPWATLSRPYYETGYVFVTSDPDLTALADLAPDRAIGATMGTAAHLRLVAYLRELPQDKRWPTYPMGSTEQALDALVEARVDVALVWAPVFWARQKADPAFAGFRVIDGSPLPPTTLGVGALMLSNETFLRTALDQAIAALSADGTVAAILEDNGFPGSVLP